MALLVKNVPEQSRFELTIDGEQAGTAAYVIDGDSITFTHTVVDGSRREKGLGGTLVRAALDEIREQTSFRVVAQCPFVAHWLDGHPEYQDLLAR
jgi:predicted GNAT family acetyltransferase